MGVRESGRRPSRQSTLFMASRPAKRPIDILTREEIHRLMKGCGGQRAIPRRNRAIIVMFWRTGLRRSEVLDLKVHDVDLDAGTIRVHFGKGQKPRTVGIDPEAC